MEMIYIKTLLRCLLNSKDKVKWYSWQNSGREYIVENKCPFCSKKLEDEFKLYMETLDNLFDKKNIEALSKMESIFDSISNLVSEETNKFIDDILKDENPISDENKEKVAKLIIEIDIICHKLLFFVQLDYSSLKDIDDLEKTLLATRFNINEYKYICGEEFLTIINELNCKIEEMQSSIQLLRKNINILNSSIKTYANKNRQRINDFLDTVGMNYEVKVENEKLLLLYKGTEIIVDANTHLRWGEKIAFALSLFLFDCKHENPDLILLDDPVSSFDFNKKYAITHYLFNQKDSLQGKTTLMLTHDLEPIINMVKIKKFGFVSSFYIENTNGVITENIILENDINSILNVTKTNYENSNINIINRLIHLRRYLELNNEYSFEYNMISSLLKGYENPKYIDGMINRNFTDEEFENTENKIGLFIKEFDYEEIQKDINNRTYMKQLYLSTTNNYEKTEIFRIILKTFGLPNVNPVLEEFINEEFHIENTYIFQLNPYAYNIVPNYIIEICDVIINRMSVEEAVLVSN